MGHAIKSQFLLFLTLFLMFSIDAKAKAFHKASDKISHTFSYDVDSSDDHPAFNQCERVELFIQELEDSRSEAALRTPLENHSSEMDSTEDLLTTREKLQNLKAAHGENCKGQQHGFLELPEDLNHFLQNIEETSSYQPHEENESSHGLAPRRRKSGRVGGAPIMRSFRSRHNRCAPGCSYVSWGVWGDKKHQHRRSCHNSGEAIDIAAIRCSGRTHHAKSRRFDQYINCMRKTYGVIYRSRNHHNHAHLQMRPCRKIRGR